MQMKKFALRGMIVLAVAVALCVLFSGTIRTLTTPKVRYASVKNGKFESVTELTGKVVFPEEEEITLEIPEGLSLTVTKVLATPGQQVKKGTKLLTAVVTDAEKTLATLQQEYDSAQNTLDTWDRKNGNIRLSRSETQWMEAYEAAREAEKTEREARLDLKAVMDPAENEEMPDKLPEGADDAVTAAFEAWQDAKAKSAAARETLAGLERYAIAEETWTLLQQRQEAEKKREDAEHQIMAIRLLSRKAETITAPHAGYIATVTATKGGTVSGDDPLMTMTPEGVRPVIRADISAVKQNVSKGTVITIPSDSWGRVETKVIDTGLDESGHPYVDAEITDDVTWSLGQVSALLKEEIKLRLTTRAQESTCLVPASAVRGSGDGRYVYIGEQETSAFAGTRIVVRKMDVTVLAESATTVSISEDLTYNKVLYMEDRVISEGGTVMLYEE